MNDTDTDGGETEAGEAGGGTHRGRLLLRLLEGPAQAASLAREAGHGYDVVRHRLVALAAEGLAARLPRREGRTRWALTAQGVRAAARAKGVAS